MQHKYDTSPSRLRLGHLILAQALSTLLVLTTPTFASSALADTTARQYQIPPGSLKDALAQFGREAQVMLSYSSELVSGLQSNGLNKTASVRDGLEQILTGTGLEAVVQENGGYMLRKSNKLATGGSESTLDEVRVSASQDPTTENTGSYTTVSSAAVSKMTMSLRDTPQSVSVITRQRMEDQNLLSVTDVLTQTTGISVLQNGPDSTDGVTYYSRGFAIENYQMDGVPMSTNQSGQNQVTDLAFYDRMEVVRGAAGLTSGVGTPAAAINLVRKKPTRKFQASVTGMAGSWDNYRGEVDISGPLTESGDVRARIVGVKQDSQSFIDWASFTKDMMYGILEVDLTPSLLFTAGFEYQKYDSDAVARAGLPLYFSNGEKTRFSRSANASAKWADYNHENSGYFISLEKHFENEWRAKAIFNHRRTDYDAMLGYAVKGRPNPDGSGLGMYASQWDAKPKQNSLDAYASGPFEWLGRKHELVVGVTASKTSYSGPTHGWVMPDITNIFQWDGNAPGQPVVPYSGFSSFSSYESAAYATIRFKPADDLSLIVGSRVSSWKQNDESGTVIGVLSESSHRAERGVVTPYAGIVYDLNESWSLYGSYTSIFKPQSNRGVNGSYLDPIEGKAYEAGVKGEFFNQQLNLSAAVFQIDQDNLAQQIVPLTPVSGYPNEFAYRAVSGTRSRGVEFEANGELQPGWQVSAGVSYSIAKDGDDEVINTYVPKTLVKLFTTYKLPNEWSKLTIGGGVNWQSKASDVIGPNSERFTQEAYVVANLLARYQFDTHLSAALNINNLFDKSYLLSPWSTYYGTPRNAMLTLKYQF